MITRRTLLAALPAAGIVTAATRAMAAPGKTLRIGFQKGEPILLTAKQNRSLETLLEPLGVEVQWIEFQFGPPLLEAMRVNAIDVGAVGDTPPVFAQAAHGDLLYIAAQRAGGQAILLPPGSSLQTLQDLKGRKVAFGRGSSAHNLTLAALEKAGLKYTDIEPIYLGPADAGPAFERGAIDAWTIWDPYYALFETRPGVRVLAKWTDITEQNSFFMARRGYVEANQQVTAKLVGEFSRIADWARSHRPDIAALLATATGMPLDAVRRGVDRAPFIVLPMDDELARSQQKVAERFRALGLIPTEIKVSDEVWRAGA
ncbi:MAG: aliphatic sulfonate ABC transporter substrate-binding protein [Acetobacteraceae bacterium]|jgi:NitT/TauT family transport system substrate-binding protein/sulfonate transport system substrate-binding protein